MPTTLDYPLTAFADHLRANHFTAGTSRVYMIGVRALLRATAEVHQGGDDLQALSTSDLDAALARMSPSAAAAAHAGWRSFAEFMRGDDVALARPSDRRDGGRTRDARRHLNEALRTIYVANRGTFGLSYARLAALKWRQVFFHPDGRVLVGLDPSTRFAGGTTHTDGLVLEFDPSTRDAWMLLREHTCRGVPTNKQNEVYVADLGRNGRAPSPLTLRNVLHRSAQ